MATEGFLASLSRSLRVSEGPLLSGMAELPKGWLVSADTLMGPGGRAFDDVAELQASTGRSIDEFELRGLSFWVWSAMGAVQATYQSVVDGAWFTCTKRGRIAAS